MALRPSRASVVLLAALAAAALAGCTSTSGGSAPVTGGPPVTQVTPSPTITTVTPAASVGTCPSAVGDALVSSISSSLNTFDPGAKYTKATAADMNFPGGPAPLTGACVAHGTGGALGDSYLAMAPGDVTVAKSLLGVVTDAGFTPSATPGLGQFYVNGTSTWMVNELDLTSVLAFLPSTAQTPAAWLMVFGAARAAG